MADSLVGLVFGLGGVLLIVGSVIILVDPASMGSGGPFVGRAVLVFCIGAGMAYVGFVYGRIVMADRLIVTSDGLVCRVTGWTSARTLTIAGELTTFATTAAAPL